MKDRVVGLLDGTRMSRRQTLTAAASVLAMAPRGSNAMLAYHLRAVPPAAQAPSYNQTAFLMRGQPAGSGAQNFIYRDGSSNNATITQYGTVQQGSFSPYGAEWSCYFDGSNGYLSHSSSSMNGVAVSGDFTFECFLMRLGTASNQGIFNINSKSNGLYIYHNMDSFTAYVGGTPMTNPSGISKLGVWQHLALVRSSGILTMYVDGSPVPGSVVNASSFTISTLRIGAAQHVTGEYFKGHISNLRFVNGSALYSGAFVPPTTPFGDSYSFGEAIIACHDNRFSEGLKPSSKENQYTVTGTVRASRFTPFLPATGFETGAKGGSIFLKDGSSLTNYLQVPANNMGTFGTGDFSVECWYYQVITPAADTNILYNGDGSSPHNWILGTVGGAGAGNRLIWAWWGVYNTSASTVPAFVNGQWYHLAVTRSSGTTRLFVNGILRYSFPDSRDYNVNKVMRASIKSGEAYVSDIRVVNGAVPATYATSSTTPGTYVFSPPSSPLGSTASMSLLMNLDQAGILDSTGNTVSTGGPPALWTSAADSKFGGYSLIANAGTTAGLDIPDAPSLRLGSAPFTIEFWANVSSSGSSRYLMAKGSAGSSGWAIFLDSANTLMLEYDNMTWMTSAVLSNTWSHIAWVREGTGTNATKVYQDGVLKTTLTVSSDFSDSNKLYVGANRSGANPITNAYLDDIRISAGVARYTAAFTPPTAGFSFP